MRRYIVIVLCLIAMGLSCFATINSVNAADSSNNSNSFTCVIYVNSREYVPITKDNTLYLILPDSEREYLESVKMTYNKDIWKVDGSNTGEIIFDLSNEFLRISVESVRDTEYYNIVVKYGSVGMPALYIDITDENYSFADVNNDKAHNTIAQGNITINDSVYSLNEADMQIKGRGNASWTRIKKGYQVKLESSAGLLGMAPAKKWILLSACADLSMVRNAAGYELARCIGMTHYIDFRYVDVYVDGNYHGLYLLCEKDEITKNRLIADASLEFDNYYSDSDVQFTTDMKNLLVTVRSNLDEDQLNEVMSLVNMADEAIYSGKDSDVIKYIDIDSFAKMWLIKEYVYDFDAIRNMHFYVYKGKVYAGQAWDFDNSMDRNASRVLNAGYKAISVDATGTIPKESSIEGNAGWLGGLLTHDVFIEKIQKLYKDNIDLFSTKLYQNKKSTELTDYIDEILNYINLSECNDTIRWSGFANFHKMTEVPVEFTDKDRLVSAEVVKNFLIKRNDYFESRIPKLTIEKEAAMTTPTPRPTRKPTMTPVPTQAPTQAPGPVAQASNCPTETPFVATTVVTKDTQVSVNIRPKLEKVKCNKNKKAVLIWKKVEGAKKYIIYRSSHSSKGFKKINTICSSKRVTFIDKTVKRHKIYYYKIKVLYSTKKSSFSLVKKVKIN